MPQSETEDPVWRAIHAFAVVLVLAFFLFSLRPVLNPFLLFLLLILLLSPLAGTRYHLLGVVAGVFNVVPYLGLIASLVPAVLIALFSGAVLISFGKIAAVFAIVQLLDGTVIGPRIVGESVGLHPVWVILALAVAGYFWGFVGLLLAIPLAVLLKLLLINGITRYENSQLFRGTRAVVVE